MGSVAQARTLLPGFARFGQRSKQRAVKSPAVFTQSQLDALAFSAKQSGFTELPSQAGVQLFTETSGPRSSLRYLHRDRQVEIVSSAEHYQVRTEHPDGRSVTYNAMTSDGVHVGPVLSRVEHGVDGTDRTRTYQVPGVATVEQMLRLLKQPGRMNALFEGIGQAPTAGLISATTRYTGRDGRLHQTEQLFEEGRPTNKKVRTDLSPTRSVTKRYDAKGQLVEVVRYNRATGKTWRVKSSSPTLNRLAAALLSR